MMADSWGNGLVLAGTRKRLSYDMISAFVLVRTVLKSIGAAVQLIVHRYYYS